MTLFDRIRRALGGGVPEIRNDNDIYTNMDSAQLLKLISYDPTPSGAVVSAETAMRVSAVYACVRVIAGAVASLPCHLYTSTEDGGRKKLPKTDLWYLLNEQPAVDWTAASMWQWVVQSILLRGDGFVWIKRPTIKSTAISSLVPLDPSNVTIQDTPEGRQYVFHYDGKMVAAYSDDVLHFPGLGFDGKRSLSVIQWAGRNAIGAAMRTDEYTGKFFAQGATPSIIIRAPGKMSDQQINRLRELWSERVGGASNAHLPLVLTENLDAKEISVSPEDSQLLETRQFQVVDIARAFGVPPFMIGETEKTTSWGSGVEMMSIGFVRYTLGPHLRQFEQELNRKLFRRAPRFLEFSVEGLLRGDSKARSDFYRQAIGGSSGPGWMTTNEIRAIENLPPIEGGETLYTPAATPKEPTNADDTPADADPSESEPSSDPGESEPEPESVDE